ncbi:hypothetical protein GCM10023321_24530 [Pseudonocardia eucalypti]|uniref:Secreted protein n=1 Tax=Pseudonocardia eucalypti TaxID=648755 RepID=A0ABP9Q486_9PSEU|nr:hypothetical protein [Pseudonocardia eucalypti]
MDRLDVLFRWQRCMWAPVPAAAEMTSSAASSAPRGSCRDWNRAWVKVGTPSRSARPASRRYSTRSLSGA